MNDKSGVHREYRSVSLCAAYVSTSYVLHRNPPLVTHRTRIQKNLVAQNASAEQQSTAAEMKPESIAERSSEDVAADRVQQVAEHADEGEAAAAREANEVTSTPLRRQLVSPGSYTRSRRATSLKLASDRNRLSSIVETPRVTEDVPSSHFFISTTSDVKVGEEARNEAPVSGIFPVDNASCSAAALSSRFIGDKQQDAKGVHDAARTQEYDEPSGSEAGSSDEAEQILLFDHDEIPTISAAEVELATTEWFAGITTTGSVLRGVCSTARALVNRVRHENSICSRT